MEKAFPCPLKMNQLSALNHWDRIKSILFSATLVLEMLDEIKPTEEYPVLFP